MLFEAPNTKPKTTHSISIPIRVYFFPCHLFTFWFALVRCEACKKFESTLCTGWMRRNNFTGFIYQFINEWQKECLNVEWRRKLATEHAKKERMRVSASEEKKRTRTMKSKFPIGFGSIERHISGNISAHNACEWDIAFFHHVIIIFVHMWVCVFDCLANGNVVVSMWEMVRTK